MNPAIPIVIPLHPKGGKFKNNTELRYALRSLEKNFADPFELVVVTSKPPDWLSGFTHLYGEGLKSSLKVAAEAYPDGFFWWYDDCCLLKPSTAEDLKVTPACRGWSKAQTGWSRKLNEIQARLKKEGYTPWDYSRPHGPYWFDKGMVDEGFIDWPGMKSKFPWESWILSKRDWPRRHGVVKQYYGPFKSPPPASSALLNYADNGNTPELNAWLDSTFPDFSRFEADGCPSVEVHTLRFGNPWWVLLCAPTLDAWCERHDYPLTCWDDTDRGYPDVKFCVIDMLKKFLEGEAEWLLYVDADILVTPEAPPINLPPAAGGIYILNDLEGVSKGWRNWVRRTFKEDTSPRNGWVYRNAGVWVCDRKGAELILSVAVPPFFRKIQEQHQWNWWLAKASKVCGLKVKDLPPVWNQFSSCPAPAHFHHLAGKRKDEKLANLRELGLVPPGQVELPPHVPLMPTHIIPKIIHTCWLSGDPLPDLQNRCIASWREKCPDYEIKIWTRENWDATPWRFAREALEHRQWAFASDVCRLDVLYRLGGIYLDFDVSVRKSFDPLLGNEFFTGSERSKTKGLITPYIMGCTSGNALMAHFLSHYDNDRPFVVEDGSFDRNPNTQVIVRQLDALGVDRYGAHNAALANKVGHVRYPSAVIGYDSPHSFAVHHFDKHWKKQPAASRENIFRKIYQTQMWGTSVSGPGSTAEYTTRYREYLAEYMRVHATRTVLDLGCGDWQFSKLMDWTGIDYTGVDIVQDAVDRHTGEYGSSNIHFVCLDIVQDELPPADLVIVKDVLQHLSNAAVLEVLGKLKSYEHVLIVQDGHSRNNTDVYDGGYRGMNLQAAPYSLHVKTVEGLFGPIPKVPWPKLVHEWRPLATLREVGFTLASPEI